MSLATDLADVAERLVALDDMGRPRQATLRRAVSTAYYAAFHFIVDCAVSSVTTAAHPSLRTFLSRTLAHSVLAKVCQDVEQGKWPKSVQRKLGAMPPAIPPELRTFAATFPKLQQRRHEADYDRSARFTRNGAKIVVDQAKQFMTDWDSVPDGGARSLFLLLLVVSETRDL